MHCRRSFVLTFALGLDEGSGRDFVVIVEINETHALCRTANGTNVLRSNADQLAVGGHHQNV
jgi:hypothetical protein